MNSQPLGYVALCFTLSSLSPETCYNPRYDMGIASIRHKKVHNLLWCKPRAYFIRACTL